MQQLRNWADEAIGMRGAATNCRRELEMRRRAEQAVNDLLDRLPAVEEPQRRAG